MLATVVLMGCASSSSTVSEGVDDTEEPTTDAAEANENTEEEAGAASGDDGDTDETAPSDDADDNSNGSADGDPDDGDDARTNGSEDDLGDGDDDASDQEADEAPEPPSAGADRSTQYTHVEDFDLEFKDARINLANAEVLFDELGEGDDIPESFDNLLSPADHDLRFDDIAPLVENELPDDLGDAMGIFVLLSSKYGLIGCEAHLRGQDGQDWNDNLFGYLLEQAVDLPADQRNNQAGLLVIGSNVVSGQLCPRLQSHT